MCPFTIEGGKPVIAPAGDTPISPFIVVTVGEVIAVLARIAKLVAAPRFSGDIPEVAVPVEKVHTVVASALPARSFAPLIVAVNEVLVARGLSGVNVAIMSVTS